MKKIYTKILIVLVLFIMLILIFNKINIANSNFTARIYIDEPTNNSIENQEMKIKGWAMSNDSQIKIKAYIDGQEKTIEKLTRTKRDDVIKAVKECGDAKTNPTPGFEGYINIKGLKEGQHKLEIKIISRENKILAEHSRIIKIENHKAKMYIDEVGQNSTLKLNNGKIRGWVMSTDRNITFKAFIDNKEQKITSNSRHQREDVIKAIEGYGDRNKNPMPGFLMNVNVNDIKDGVHKLKVQIVSKTGEILTQWEQTIQIKKYNARTYIDEPTNNSIENQEMKIRGWAMSDDNQIKIKAYIDGQEKTIEKLTRTKRDDVIKAVKECGDAKTNPTPAFEGYINIKGLKEGQHKLEIKIISRENVVIATHSRIFKSEPYKAKMYIDEVGQNNTLKLNNGKIRGWVMSTDRNITFKAFIDNKEQKITSNSRHQREDVIKAIEGYGDRNKNPMPGFLMNVNVNDIKDGVHKLKVQIVSKTGEILTQWEQTIQIKKYNARTYIDEPTNNSIENQEMKVRGWAMSDDNQIKIKAYIDGQEKTIEKLTRTKRDDVIKAVKECGDAKTNPTPAFEGYINIKGLKEGQHKLEVKVISRENVVIATHSRIFKSEPYKAKMYIDEVGQNNTLKLNNGKIRGWVMSTDRNITFKAFIDNKEQKITSNSRHQREDVIKAIEGYGDRNKNPMPGFLMNVNVNDIKDGTHKLKIQIISKDGNILTQLERTIGIKKYNTQIYIDSPRTTYIAGNSLYLRGWVMSEIKDKEIIAKVDGKQTIKLNSENRPDVIATIKGYGNKEQNPIPGFNAQVDISKLSNGQHTITIEVHNKKLGEIIEKRQVIFKKVEEIKYNAGTYGVSGASKVGAAGGTQLQYLKFGTGPNVFFATFCVHGYEDSWDRDGTVLVNIANNFYNTLIQNKDYSLAEKWTVYVIPEVNPDGRRLGYTKNGPGRTTLYSKVGRGIDINRSWQTGASYKRFTDNRNYNGTEGFQAYEAEALRDFLLSHKAKNGQTILVDLHGWEDQLIGDPQVCQYYKQQYTSCSTRNYGGYGNQYLVTWARMNLGARSSLVELPLARNEAEVNSMRLSDKYINATIKMLKEV